MPFDNEPPQSPMLGFDELRALIEPIVPKHPYVLGVGKPRKVDCVGLTSLVYILKDRRSPGGLSPGKMGCCGMTLWHRLVEWRGPGSGNNCTGFCWTNSAVPSRSNSRWLSSTPPPSVRSTGAEKGTQRLYLNALFHAAGAGQSWPRWMARRRVLASRQARRAGWGRSRVGPQRTL